MRALVFDSVYDQYLGTLCFFKIVDGKMRLGDKVRFMASGKEYEIIETYEKKIVTYENEKRDKEDEILKMREA